MTGTGIEFEQKFVLDIRKAAQIAGELSILALRRDHTIVSIRQYYDEKGERFRCSQSNSSRFVRETKKSIKVGAVYSISIEEEDIISEEEFEFGWEKNNTRRLQKIRHSIPGRYPDHKVVVDFFYTTRQEFVEPPHVHTYAIIAEVETMLTAQTTDLYLRFQLPIYLEKHLLLAVDDSDPDMKVFKSANMVDVPENIEAVTRAISNLYDRSP